MALKITLKPGERVIIGGAVITNGALITHLIIGNTVPVLRQKDIISEDEADTPCKRIYLVVQLMYVDSANLSTHHNTYWSLVKDVLKAAPSTLPIIDRMNHLILENKYYQALKIAKKLIEYEEAIVKHVRNAT